MTFRSYRRSRDSKCWIIFQFILFALPAIFVAYFHPESAVPTKDNSGGFDVLPSYEQSLLRAGDLKIFRPWNKNVPNNVVHIVLCFDTGSYNLGMKAMINSLIMNTETPSRLAFHFIVKPEDNYPAAYFVAELEQRWPDLYFDHRIWRHWERVLSAGYPSNSRFSNSLNIARIYLGILFPRLHKVISMDTDQLVLGDIVQLWDNANVENQSIAAPWQSNGTSLLHYVNTQHPVIQASNLEFSSPIFGAGLFVANLTRWRAKRIQVPLQCHR